MLAGAVGERAGARGERSARQMFAVSLLYLFLVFAALLADHGMAGLR